MSTSSTTTIYMGTTLKLQLDEGSSFLAIVKADGSLVNIWGQTLQFAFAPQQTTVTLLVTPVGGTSAVTASYVNLQGSTVQSTEQSGSAMLTIQRPPSTGVSFTIQLEQDSALSSFRLQAPAASARVASSSKLAGLVSTDSSNPQPTGPSARLQTRLVFSTVEPPPDPDGRPTLPAG
jgi:hypothetical protein